MAKGIKLLVYCIIILQSIFMTADLAYGAETTSGKSAEKFSLNDNAESPDVPFLDSQRMGNGGWGYVDQTGKQVIPPFFQEAKDFSGGLGEVKLNDKWGYIDERGNIVIPPVYDDTKGFSEGLAPVCQNGKWAYIDKRGKPKTDFKFTYADKFSQGLAKVSESAGGKNNFRFISADGQYKSGFSTYDGARRFAENLAAVRKGDKWGYINTEGKLLIPFKYDDALRFSYGLAPVMIGTKWGYIDNTGKEVIAPAYEYAGFFTEKGAVVYQNNETFIINSNGQRNLLGGNLQGGDYVNPAKWMNYWIFDDVFITDLTVPGTHDSAAYAFTTTGPWANCQSYNVESQLKMGVRYLDIRVGIDKGEVKIWHGSAGQGNLTLRQIMMQIANFLNANPSEAIMISFKIDDGSSEDRIVPLIEQILYSPEFKNYIFDEPRIPRLREVRGKYLYWHRNYTSRTGKGGLTLRFSATPKDIGWGKVDQPGIALLYEDECNVKPPEKLKIIFNWLYDHTKICQNLSNNVYTTGRVICLTYTSGYHSIAPVNLYAAAVNKWLEDRVHYETWVHKRFYRYGIVAMDYINPFRSDIFWMMNFYANLPKGNLESNNIASGISGDTIKSADLILPKPFPKEIKDSVKTE